MNLRKTFSDASSSEEDIRTSSHQTPNSSSKEQRRSHVQEDNHNQNAGSNL